jgi:hypothetical protein
MTRATLSSAIPADRAEVLSDNEREYSIEEEAFIAHRSDELLKERLNDRALFHDLMAGIDATEIEPHMIRAVLNLDAACKGNQDAYFGITAALAIIQRTLRQEARTVWADECRAEAERQLGEEA